MATFLIIAFGICGELLASYLVSFAMGSIGATETENAYIAALVSARLIFFVMTIIATGLTRHQKEGGPIQYVSALAMLLPVVSIGLVIYIFSLAEFDQNTILETGSIGAVNSVIAIVWTNLITVWLFDKQSHTYQMERETQILRKTILVQQEHYNGEMEKRKAIRKIRHDYRNFLLGIQTELATGKIEEACRIIDRELGKEVISGSSQSNWYALDAIVSYKETEAKKQGISIITDYYFEDEPKVSSEDICVMIGNALDNAVEYLTANPNLSRQIKLRARYLKGVLDIKISNEIDNQIPIRDQRYCESSKTGEEHGYGLKSIDYIAEKYHGRLILLGDDKHFECGMILYC